MCPVHAFGWTVHHKTRASVAHTKSIPLYQLDNPDLTCCLPSSWLQPRPARMFVPEGWNVDRKTCSLDHVTAMHTSILHSLSDSPRLRQFCCILTPSPARHHVRAWQEVGLTTNTGADTMCGLRQGGLESIETESDSCIWIAHHESLS